MPRPIPVFEFVIAAYARTCAGRDFAQTAERVVATVPEIAADSALRLATPDGLWANLSDVMVKVSVGDRGPTGGPQALGPGVRAAGPIEDLWLCEIAETPSGYLGVVCCRPENLKQVLKGDTIAFLCGHVLEWKHAEPETSAAAPPLFCEPMLPVAEAART